MGPFWSVQGPQRAGPPAPSFPGAQAAWAVLCGSPSPASRTAHPPGAARAPRLHAGWRQPARQRAAASPVRRPASGSAACVDYWGAGARPAACCRVVVGAGLVLECVRPTRAPVRAGHRPYLDSIDVRRAFTCVRATASAGGSSAQSTDHRRFRSPCCQGNRPPFLLRPAYDCLSAHSTQRKRRPRVPGVAPQPVLGARACCLPGCHCRPGPGAPSPPPAQHARLRRKPYAPLAVSEVK